VSKSLKKGSKAAKAWGEKMRRLRGRVRKTTTRRRRTTRKGDLTLKRKKAFPSKRKSNKPQNSPRKSMAKAKSWSSKFKTGTIGKVLMGLGAAQAAALAVGIIAPQYIGIAKPVAALAAGGIPGVAAELVIDQGLLGNVMGMFGGGAVQNGAGGL
jgi:hypothetical protein